MITKCINLLFMMMLLSHTTIGQLISGKIVDEQTGNPVPYVHIGVLGKNMGVISRENGEFSIDVSKAEKIDQLHFSIVGYHLKSMAISDLDKKEALVVKVKAKIYVLNDVEVTASRIKDKVKPVKLGRYMPTKWTNGQSGIKDFGWGGEYGLKILNEGKKYNLLQVAFHMRHNTVDSILFRINIYDENEDELPNQSILTKEVFTKAYRKDSWITADISSQQLIMDQNLFATYEVVRVWFSEKGENQMFFTRGGGYERGGSYGRKSSMDKWHTEEKEGLIGYVTMYLLGQEIDE